MPAATSCPSCQSELIPGSKFCHVCGQAVEPAAAEAQSGAPSGELSPEAAARAAKGKQLMDEIRAYLAGDPTKRNPFDFLLTHEVIRSLGAHQTLVHGGQLVDFANAQNYMIDRLWPSELPEILESGLVITTRVRKNLRRVVAGVAGGYAHLGNLFLQKLCDSKEEELNSLLVDGKPRAQIEGVTIQRAYKDAEIYYKRYLDKDYAGSLKGFEHLKALNPYDAYFRNMVGSNLYCLGKYREALAESVFARALDQDSVDVTSNLLQAMSVLGFYPSMLRIGREVESAHARESDKNSYRAALRYHEIARVVTTGFANLMVGVGEDEVAGERLDKFEETVVGEDPVWIMGRPSDREPGSETHEPVYKGRKVFISYRRADCADVATWLYDEFKTEMPDLNVFRDERELDASEDYVEALNTQVSSSDVMIVLIGDRWAPSRLQNPKDILRREIQRALRAEVSVMPVLVDGTAMPDGRKLPGDLAKIATLQAVPLRREKRDKDFFQLRLAVENAITERRVREKSLPDVDELTDDQIEDALEDFERYVPAQAKEGEGIRQRRFPQYGDWEVLVKAPSRGIQITLEFTIEKIPGSPFEGTMTTTEAGWGQRAQKRRLEGNWALILDTERHLVLGLALTGVMDDFEKFSWQIPMTQKAGSRYIGRGEDGSTYSSRNAAPRPGGF